MNYPHFRSRRAAGPRSRISTETDWPTWSSEDSKTASQRSSATSGSLYGDVSGLPQGSESRLDPTDGFCSMGAGTATTWSAVPAPADGGELLGWLVVAHNAEELEGSWGRDHRDLQRRGPGPGGASDSCAAAGKLVLERCD